MAGRWLGVVGFALLCSGCSSGPSPEGQPTSGPADLRGVSGSRAAKSGASKKNAAELEDPVFDQGDTPEERRYMEAGKPFILAIAGNDPAGAYACLSQHARAQMQMLQFRTPQSETEQAELAKLVFKNVSGEKFSDLFHEVTTAYGKPKAVKRLYCFETDPNVLSGKGEPMETLFAIGGMPATIPASIRRASLRGQVGVQWRPDELARQAKEYGLTEEELLKDEESQPYFNLKFVLVDENGELKVGYFEFMPPSIMD